MLADSRRGHAHRVGNCACRATGGHQAQHLELALCQTQLVWTGSNGRQRETFDWTDHMDDRPAADAVSDIEDEALDPPCSPVPRAEVHLEVPHGLPLARQEEQGAVRLAEWISEQIAATEDLVAGSADDLAAEISQESLGRSVPSGKASALVDTVRGITRAVEQLRECSPLLVSRRTLPGRLDECCTHVRFGFRHTATRLEHGLASRRSPIIRERDHAAITGRSQIGHGTPSRRAIQKRRFPRNESQASEADAEDIEGVVGDEESPRRAGRGRRSGRGAEAELPYAEGR